MPFLHPESPTRDRARPLRRILAWAAVAGVLTVVAIAASWIARAAWVGTGFYAKQLCSGVLAAGRAPEEVAAHDLAVMWPGVVFRRIAWDVDAAAGRARASWLGFASREARYRRGFGCTLASAPGSPLVPVSAYARTGAELPAGNAEGSAADRLGANEDADARAAPIPALDRLLDETFAASPAGAPPTTRAVVVVRHGRIVAERYAKGFGPDTRFSGWSLTKSVFNAVVGALVAHGALDVGEPVRIAAWRAPGDPRGALTYDHLLRMSSGLSFSEHYEDPFSDVARMLFVERSAGAYAATRPLGAAPGTTWAYTSGTTNALALALRQHVPPGMRYQDLPRRLLFEPLGMTSAMVELDEDATFIASSYMLATARDWARFGALFAADGVWAGTRVLPEGWVTYSRTRAPADPRGRYGAHFWLYDDTERAAAHAASPRPLPDDAFFAGGFGGQRITIVPSLDLVVVRLGYDVGAARFDNAAFFARAVEALEGASR
jgi:CubicO group peptidase (beta-lactamase class C family)